MLGYAFTIAPVVVGSIDMLRQIFGFIAGAICSLVYVLSVGLLLIQADGVRSGVALDLNNQVVSVIGRGLPVLQWVGILAIGTLIVLVLATPRTKPGQWSHVFFRFGFALCTLGSILYGLIGLITMMPERTSYADGSLSRWQGWIRQAAMDPAVHLMFVIALVATIAAWNKARVVTPAFR